MTTAPALTAQQFAKATGATLLRSAFWLPHLVAAMSKYGIDTPLREAAFLAQISVESGRLATLEENLNYSAERLVAVWPKRFPDSAAAAPYARNPEALANRVYGGRMGNTAPGDGWRYRGRGLKQLTGKHNDIAYMLAADIDCVEHPDLLLEPRHAADSAAWFWSVRGCNQLADTLNWTELSTRINGGYTGLSERITQTHRALEALSVQPV